MNNTFLDFYKETVKDLKKNEIISAGIDAQIIFEFVTKKSREFLLANPDYKLKKRDIEKIKKITKLRLKHYPISYIVGNKEFFSLNFEVSPDVLIPRPETELIVEKALEFIKTKKQKNLAIIDVGTGSGNIIISIAKNINPDSQKVIFFASDTSEKALRVAKKNNQKHQTNVNFIKSDLFTNIDGSFDLIVANLPYVPENGSENDEIRFEPQNAIFSGKDGTVTIFRFLQEAKKHITKNGQILVEADTRNIKKIQKYALKIYSNAKILTDLSGKPRLLSILSK
jgi:release factor glutamine methyltransferase